MVVGDVRAHLANEEERLDLVILNLPEPASSILNRYFTIEFYRQISDSLGENGVVAVRTSGGENIMGTELINLGASVMLTLEEIFGHIEIVPGQETWFIASNSEILSGEYDSERSAALISAFRSTPSASTLSIAKAYARGISQSRVATVHFLSAESQDSATDWAVDSTTYGQRTPNTSVS